jgi:hypothetical protein
MQKQNQSKLFAFKLAEKQEQTQATQQWKVRDGVAVAGCTGPLPDEYDNWREWGGYFQKPDQGLYC